MAIVLQGETEGVISSQGKADDINMAAPAQAGYLLHGPEGFRKQGAVEKSLIKMMRFSMIPKIEPEDIESPLEEIGRRGEDIGRIGAPFPAMNEGDQAAAVTSRLPGVITKEANTVAAVKDDRR